MKRKWLILLLSLVWVACQPAGVDTDGDDSDEAQVDPDKPVPISRVVLYRSGIAYVERSGTVNDDVLRLQIRPEQINDILTTLTVIVDEGRNVASSVGLPIERTVAHDLGSLPTQVQQQGGMVSLLEAFRGAEVEIEGNLGAVQGRLVGSENLTNDDGNLIRYVTVLTDDEELRQIRVDSIRRVQVANHALGSGLETSLDISLGEGDWKPIELEVHLSGDPPHDVFLSYVVEMPTWKPTYRIIVEDEQLYVQGWAVVDNISGEDWEDISLSLVAGSPISFEYDLHSPRFVGRPDLTNRGFVDTSVMAPPIDDGIVVSSLADRPNERERSRDMPRPSGAATGRTESTSRSQAFNDPYWDDDDEGGDMAPEPEAPSLRLAGGSSAQAQQLENLFRYDVGYGITVEDRDSALVTLLNEPVEGEDVLYYDPSNNQGNPYRAIRMVNDSGFTLERGPLSIFEGNTFVGQAIAPRINEDELVFLPYSLDGRFRVDVRESNDEEGLRLVRIVNSVIYSEVQNNRRRTYQVTNNSGDPTTMYVRIPKRTNWFLTEPEADSPGVIDQGSVWYVPLALDGGQSQEFVVSEATTVTRSIEIWDAIAADTISMYISSTDTDPEVTAVLQSVLEQRNRIAEVQREAAQARRTRSEVSSRMGEIRNNLDALGDSRQSRELRRDLESRLGDMEEQSTELTIQIISLDEEEAELRAQIATQLLDLELQDPREEGE
ncbi:MAG: hypothetical protein KC561_05030 [Myxococcales bacterium]|nr:hypothetical protein [Myxococcales bacterium]